MPSRPDLRRPRPARRPRRRVVARLLIAGLLLVAVASCSTIEAFTDLSSALRNEGFSDVEVTVGGGDPVVLVVRADAPAGSSTEEGLDEATEVVWESFPRRFDVLRLTVDGETRQLDYADVEEELGERRADLDETDLTDEVTRLSLGLVLGLILGGVLFVAVAGMVVLILIRRRRRRGVVGGPPPGGPTAWVPPGGPPPAWAPAPQEPDAMTPSGPPGPADPTGAPPTWSSPPPEPVAPPEPPPSPEERRERAQEARRIGRRPRGPRPPATQTPRGWDR